MADDRYDSVARILSMAMRQCSEGKGKERHVVNDNERFEDQLICMLRRRQLSGPLSQAVKKIDESSRMEEPERRINELLGAIIYICAEIIVLEEESCARSESNQTATS